MVKLKSSKYYKSTNFACGRINKTSAGYDINYFITDHLGSTRVIVGSNGEIKEQKDYYPFGKEHENPNLISSTNRWGFSGKEKQTVKDLGWLDFTARMLSNSEIPLFTTQDPLQEEFYSWSSYSYCMGNPLNRIDPDGKNPYLVASSYVNPDGVLLRHFDDDDPTIYIVPDNWTGSQDELDVFGYEYPGIDYSANIGKNIEDVGYRGIDPRLYPDDPPITPDYTLDAIAVPVLGWLKFVKLGKLFNFAINKGAKGGFKSVGAASRSWKDAKMINDNLLKKQGLDAHAIKREFLGQNAQISKYDLYKHTDTGEIIILGKGGKGTPVFTGYFIK